MTIVEMRRTIDDLATIIRRPHFHLVGNDLFFLISRRAHGQLSTAEAGLWSALEAAPQMGELRRQFPGEADAAIARFIELGVCEPTDPRPPSGRRRIIVFEPHSDDAALSLGGIMWMRRHDCEFVVVTIAGRSNCTSYYHLDREFFDVDEITSLRHAESMLFAGLLGARYQALDQSDAPLRYHAGNWSLDWFRRHRSSIGAFVVHHSSERELLAWTDAVKAVLRDADADEVWIPLGSPHTDHELARNACLAALLEGPAAVATRTVRLYEEVPYTVWFPEYAASVVNSLTSLGAALSPEAVPISDAFTDKLRHLSVFGSQFTVSAMRADVEKGARQAAGGQGMAERLWRLDRPPHTLSPLAISADETAAVDARRIAPWVGRQRQAARLRLLLLAPAGRWREDMELLFGFFPAARFDVYASTAALAEVESFASPRIRVYPVAAGWAGWAPLALRMPLMRPMPTLFIAGDRRLQAAQRAARLWAMSDTLVLPSMDRLVRTLRQLGPSGAGDAARVLKRDPAPAMNHSRD